MKTLGTRMHEAARSGLLTLCLAALVFAAACSKQEAPPAEYVIRSSAYGHITQITPAVMDGREIRSGDLALTVDLDNGQTVIVIQAEDDIFTVGDRVRILRDGMGLVRVQVI